MSPLDATVSMLNIECDEIIVGDAVCRKRPLVFDGFGDIENEHSNELIQESSALLQEYAIQKTTLLSYGVPLVDTSALECALDKLEVVILDNEKASALGEQARHMRLLATFLIVCSTFDVWFKCLPYALLLDGMVREYVDVNMRHWSIRLPSDSAAGGYELHMTLSSGTFIAYSEHGILQTCRHQSW